jgi:DnaJ domain
MLHISAGLEDYHEYYRLSNKNYYYDLHLENDATMEQIKTAFKELALRLHPDKNDGDERAKDAFKRVSGPAFRSLSLHFRPMAPFCILPQIDLRPR